MTDRTQIMDPQRVEHKLQRIARQIREKHFHDEELFIVGIRNNGERIAQRVRYILEDMGGVRIRSASISLNKKDPLSEPPEPAFSFEELDGHTVILVDDVVNSGKTLAHTTKTLLQRPLSDLTTVALVDREHHRFPIRADLVGTTLATTMKQHIEVEPSEDGERVYLE